MVNTQMKIAAVIGLFLLVFSIIAVGGSIEGAAAAQNAADSSAIIDIRISDQHRTIVDEEPQHNSTDNWQSFDESSKIQTLTGDPAVQNLTIRADVAGDEGVQELVIDINQSINNGLEVASVDAETGNTSLSDNDNGNVEVRNGAGEIAILVDTSKINGTNLHEHLEVTWGGEIDISSSYTTTTVKYITIFNGTTDYTHSRLLESAPTGIYQDDVNVTLDSDTDVGLSASRNGDNGVFRVWGDQIVTLQAGNNTDRIHIYEYETNTDGEVVRGSRVAAYGTAPGAATNIDMTGFNADTRYIIDFVDDDGPSGNPDDVVVIEVDPLNLASSWSQTQDVGYYEEVDIEVTSSDITGGSVQVTIYDYESETIQYETQTDLDGNGAGSVTVIPELDFADGGVGNYFAVVEHEESEVTVSTGILSTVESVDLEAKWQTDVIQSNKEAVLDVYSDEISDTEVTVTIYDSGQETAFNTTTATLDNSGNLTLSYNPENGLDGPGEYVAVVELADPEANITSNVLKVVEPVAPQDNLTYSFEIPNDGNTYSVGVPGEVNGTLADMLDPDAEGYTVYRWVNGSWQAVHDFASTSIEPLEAFVIATEGKDGQPDTFDVDIEFEAQSTATPPQKELQEGWNFVAAPRYDNLETVFGISDVYLVLDRFGGPQSAIIEGVDSFDAHYIGEDQNQVSPFKGYFVFVEEDATLPGVLSGAETRDEVEEQLKINLTIE